MKRFLSILLALTALLAALSGCAQKESSSGAASLPALSENIPDDNCRNWYEIYIYSFQDSDGDRIGDFRGATEKLDYVRDMGFTGIWLMPIMPSPSYHKYDITDYYSIDPDYGTMEDFEAFLNRAHELGIKVILDLVVNHTSSEHPWFLESRESEDSARRDWYNWSSTGGSGYTEFRGSHYESRFVSSMPDLNLDNEEVRAEIVNIMAYWLDLGVDGFRLDAVTSYYTNELQKNVDFLSWLNDEAKKLSPDCYIVGECWSDESTIRNYYASGIDSFFCFPVATSGGFLAKTMDESATNRGETYAQMTLTLEERFGTDILMAPFLGNHDTDRIANAIGTYDLKRLKAVHGMLAMMRGGIYEYYGDEVGMLGTGKDPNKRIGMNWTGITETTKCPPGTTEANYVLPTVTDQLADENSLANYVRNAMQLRNALPEIARGVSSVLPCEDGDVCILRRTLEDSSVIIVLNLSNANKTVSVDAQELLGYLDANTESGDGVGFSDGKLSLEPWGIAVLR